MSNMILYLDELGEDERPKPRRLEVDPGEAGALLEGTDYGIASDLEADFEADRIDSTIRIVGPLHTTVEYQCGRCLETRQRDLDVEAEFVLMERDAWRRTYETDEEVELDADDMDVSFYEGEEIDLAPLVREAILLELPTLPRCPAEERQACDEAFERNVGEETLADLDEAAMDQRWAPLKNIKLKE